MVLRGRHFGEITQTVLVDYPTQGSWRAHIGEGNIWREPFGEFIILTRNVSGGQHFTRHVWRDNFSFSGETTFTKHLWGSDFYEAVLTRHLWEGIFDGTLGMLKWNWRALFTGGQCSEYLYTLSFTVSNLLFSDNFFWLLFQDFLKTHSCVIDFQIIPT